MINQPQVDPWDEANNPPEMQFKNYLWGKAALSAKSIALVKGLGKVDYDPQAHGDNRHTGIYVQIETLPEMGIENENVSKRDTLSWAKDWKTITLPSIQALGVTDAREMNGKWVKIESVPTGETYQKNNETKSKTAFKFTRIFKDEAECRADCAANDGFRTPKDEASPAPATPPVSNEVKFLHAILKNITSDKKDAEAWAALDRLKEFPQVAHFGKESPEVAQWMNDNNFLPF